MTTLAAPFLVGPRLFLRSLTAADAEGAYPSWLNDEEVCRGNSHHVFPYTREAALGYIRRVAEARDELVLAMVVHEGDRHIGNIALQDIRPVSRSAELAILIGDRSAWGKGYGFEAAALLRDHAFSAMNLNRIECGTFEDNEAMKRLALKLGMREEGRRRAAAFKGGRYVDIIEYGILRGDPRGSGEDGGGVEPR